MLGKETFYEHINVLYRWYIGRIYQPFMVVFQNLTDPRSDEQVLQSDALRTCYNVRRRDRLSICKLHAEAKLLSLEVEQRRNIQLLSFMYLHTKNHDVQRVVRRATRGACRYKFSVEIYNTVKYKNSPFYKGCDLWNTTIESETLFEKNTSEGDQIIC